MPHIIVKLVTGKSDQQKLQLSDAIIRDVMHILDCGEESISVAVEEVRLEEWAEKVYRPDIKSKWEQLAKKPGYTM